MSEPIKEGDLVAVVRPTPCCASTVGMGSVYTVVHLGRFSLQCLCCGEVFEDETQAAQFFIEASPGKTYPTGHLISRLKRIPPLEELEGEKRDEEIAA